MPSCFSWSAGRQIPEFTEEGLSRAATAGFDNDVKKIGTVLYYKGKILTKTHAKDKFVLGYIDCKHGKQHLRESTLDSIRNCREKLSCVFCVKNLTQQGWEIE